MSMKLYPPYIEGKISAQAGAQLKIPFEMNRAVGASEISFIKAQIKTVSTSTLVTFLDSALITDNTVFFNIETSLLKIGQFYKIQLAYVDTDGQVGYYSTVGIFKYTAEPIIYIGELSNGQVNNSLVKYNGFYSNSDMTEKEYSYRFDIYEDESIVHSSGELIHNVEDEFDSFIPTFMLSAGKRYKIVYTTTSINGITAAISYYLMDRVESEIPFAFGGELIARADNNNGTISIEYKNNGIPVSGRFRLLRFSDMDYEILGSFIISQESVTLINLYTDYAISQGVKYKYALQQFNEKIKSKYLYSNEIQANYEDMFLSDGERQLRICFDPRITSFKTSVLESKVDTLGSKYPVFFRNGHSAYKEFPISGLISMHMDNDLFMPSRTSTPDVDSSCVDKTTDLTTDNIYLERKFKIQVLDWLNNGKPKLFRSATEGNYIVRLMNVSLSPNDTLGRMLHTFSAQAYEIMEYNTLNLFSQNLIPITQDLTEIAIRQVSLTNSNNTFIITGGSRHITVIGPVNTEINFTFDNNTSFTAHIGTAQIYRLPLRKDILVTSVSVSGLTPTEVALIEYDESYKKNYPILIDGQEIIGVIYNEHSVQYTNATVIIDENINLLTENNLEQNFNILSLTLTAKLDQEGERWAIIRFVGDETDTVLQLTPQNLTNDLIGFGHINLTCDMFDEKIFKPVKLIVSDGLYTNIYYSTSEYKYSISEGEM